MKTVQQIACQFFIVTKLPFKIMRGETTMIFKIIASIVFTGLFVARIVNPDLKIDTTSIILLVLAFVPWFVQYIKSLEINGIGKVELIAKEQKDDLEQKAEESGILSQQRNTNGSTYPFNNLRYEDPKLALAALRIDIENSLRKIAESHKLDTSSSGLVKMTKMLIKNECISSGEATLIYDISGILNRAVHSQLKEYESESFDWVFDLGVKLVDSLNDRVKENSNE